MIDSLHVAQVSCYVDPLERDSETLLDAWPTLGDVACAASRAGVRVSVVQAASVDAELMREGVRYHFVREPRPSVVRRRAGLWAAPLTRRTLRRVVRMGPDLVHFHSLSFPRHVRYLARIQRSPVLVQDHADHPPPGWRRWLVRDGLRRVAAAAFTTRDLAEPWLRSGLLRRGLPIHEVLESSSHFTPGSLEEARARSGIRGDPAILWLGHLDANKDPLTVLEGFSRAVPRLKDPHLWLCYLSAPLLEQVRDRVVSDPALRGRTHLLGARPHHEVEALLRSADFLIQGSHKEGSGYAVIEALACGTTPLVTDIPSFRRLTGDGAVGSLVPPGDPGGFERSIVEWSGRERRQLRTRARAHFEATLSFDVVGRELRSAYERVASHERPGKPAEDRLG